MKTISGAFQSHLDQTVTTLATLWKIVRRDGTEKFFTDHDRDLVFGGNTYHAAAGYMRTAIAQTAGLAVDNMDVQGVFDETQVSEEELKAGLYDFADVYVSVVNWADLSQGAIMVRRGKFGEVMTTEQGYYTTELRGMAQLLGQQVVQVYAPECRVDLGSSQCKMPILPPILERDQAVVVGDFYRVPTDTSAGVTWNHVVRNAGFELDTVGTAKTQITGWTVLSGLWNIYSSNQGLDAHSGARFLSGGGSASGTMEQRVDLLNIGLDPDEIDAGDVEMDFSIQRANQTTTLDTGRVLVQFVDENGAVIGTALDTGLEAITPQDTWTERSVTNEALPSGTRFIRVALSYVNVGGGNADTSFDSITMTVRETARNKEHQEIFANRIYQVVESGTTDSTQPAYDTTVGEDTTDGTATLRAVEAWTRHAYVTEVIDHRTCRIQVDEPRAVDGWFELGGAVFETSRNRGKALEMKDWTQSTGELAFYLAPAFPLQVGARLHLYAGCDKRLDTCADKFDNAINFRGEPYIPGSDVLNSYEPQR